ncbi:MAG: thioredoxin domain-containing protein [Pyramidobacter sp.]|jgi:uncharacterized protein YyaL (SSP411 family)
MSLSEKSLNPFVKRMGEGAVSWLLWTPEAVEKAEALDLPLCLCIMNSKSRWSFVMKENFNESEIISMLNNDFIPVLADSDDVPHLTLAARTMAQIMMGHAGWPLFLFMTPQKKTIFASSYMPRQSKDSRMPGLLDVLRRIKWLWLMKRPQINDAAESYGAQLAQALLPYEEQPSGNLEDRAAAQILEEQDLENGGFGGSPKFPQATKLLLALHLCGTGCRKEEMERFLEKTFSALFSGGLYDHAGGGFHDYCCDARWEQPNLGRHVAQNLSLLWAWLEGFRLFRKPLYRYVVEKSLVAIAQDFDRGDGLLHRGDEVGDARAVEDFYLWSHDEVRSLPGFESEFCDVWNVGPESRYRDPMTSRDSGRNVLHPVPAPEMESFDDDVFSGWLSKYSHHLDTLAAGRASRRRVAREEKISVRENALFAGLLAKAAVSLNRPSFAERASKMMGLLLQQAVTEGGLCHSLYGSASDGTASLDDVAALVWGCLQLHKAQPSAQWLAEAERWCHKADELFGGSGAFRLVAEGTLEVAPAWDGGDDVLPSGNGILVNCLLTLYEMTGDAAWKKRAGQVVRAFGGALNEYPAVCAALTIGALRLEGLQEAARH